jgi:hypothetical protein
MRRMWGATVRRESRCGAQLGGVSAAARLYVERYPPLFALYESLHAPAEVAGGEATSFENVQYFVGIANLELACGTEAARKANIARDRQKYPQAQSTR